MNQKLSAILTFVFPKFPHIISNLIVVSMLAICVILMDYIGAVKTYSVRNALRLLSAVCRPPQKFNFLCRH